MELDVELARVAAVLLEDRVVRRVIKKHRALPGIGLQVPHAQSYLLPRADLEALVDRDELPIDPATLPERVVIFGGSRDALEAGERTELSRAWRAIFHGHVHRAFDELLARGQVTAAAIRERVHHIGQTEFDEIRSVLAQEDLLLPPSDEIAIYGEFVALYLELRYFAPDALDRTFPAVDVARVDAAIALDLDGAALLAGARPSSAPSQPVLDEPSGGGRPARAHTGYTPPVGHATLAHAALAAKAARAMPAAYALAHGGATPAVATAAPSLAAAVDPAAPTVLDLRTVPAVPRHTGQDWLVTVEPELGDAAPSDVHREPHALAHGSVNGDVPAYRGRAAPLSSDPRDADEPATSTPDPRQYPVVPSDPAHAASGGDVPVPSPPAEPADSPHRASRRANASAQPARPASYTTSRSTYQAASPDDNAQASVLPAGREAALSTGVFARVRASRARLRGNRARAAILAMRAGDRATARADLDELSARLARAIGVAPDPSWSTALVPVVELAATHRGLGFTPAARLLYDLQTACVVAEHELKVVDPGTWLLSLGKRPVVRTLPATREVRVAKHLRAAGRKLAACALPSTADHQRLATVLSDLAYRGDANVRIALRPKIEAALDEVALQPRNLPERVAQKKLVDELLDHAVARGRMSIGNLRDAISNNDLKMPDLRRYQLRAGDELLRCDRALSLSLDGVYRRGEGYLRALQKISSVLFGTAIGRFLTLYLILPLLGSFTVFEGAQHMVNPVAHYLGREAPAIATRTTVWGGAVFLFILLHIPPLRRAVWLATRLFGRLLRLILLDAPRALFRRPLVRQLLDSRFANFVIKPGVPAAIAALILRDPLRWPIAGAVYAMFAAGLNSRLGRDAQEVVADGLVRSSRQLTTRILPGMVRWILDVFAKLMELFDRGMYRVDEWLRFRTGESRITLVIKGLLGTVWSVFAYFARLYIALFIEPGVNPIKHFPVVTVAAKVMVPLYPAMLDAIAGPSKILMGSALGTSFAAFTVFVIPGVAGFLVWEFKENWKLYRRSRSKTLAKAAIGHHGESMVRYLKPGFYSGTIPKRFTKLRRAAWKADERGVDKHRDELHHIEETIYKFADRELVSMLNEATSFRLADVAVVRVAVGSNRVQIDLACPSASAEHARIVFEQQSGWLLASLPELGWIDRLDSRQRQIFEIALAGFYRRSGVDLVREQLEHVLAGNAPVATIGAPTTPAPSSGTVPPYDIADEGMLVWPGQGYQTEAVYDLRALSPSPRLRGAPWSGALPTFAGHRALYFRETLTWAMWTNAWEQLARGEPPPQIVVGPSLLRSTAQGASSA